MNNIGIVTAVISSTIAFAGIVIGGLLAHRLTLKRDRQQRTRERVVTYLVDAWRNLEKGSRDNVDEKTKADALELAIADVQLFGSPEQIRLAQTIAIEMSKSNSANTTDLLARLRDDLRAELDLAKSPVALFFFRVTMKRR